MLYTEAKYLLWCNLPRCYHLLRTKKFICVASRKTRSIKDISKDRLGRNYDIVSVWSDMSTNGLLF